MKSYAKYTISTTFRICFTFGLLTVIYDFYFPTILIVLLAVTNDGAMISLSKDNVKYSAMPDQWKLSKIFSAGIIYGLYLTLSTWILFHTTAFSSFFANMGLPDLRWDSALIANTCQALGASDMATCTMELLWERQSMLRALIYGQVSISGMALIFVVRTKKHSLTDRPGTMLMLAFFCSQLIACVICGLGLNGYPFPVPNAGVCVYCQHGLNIASPTIENIESTFTGSVIGSQGYVLVAIIWSLLFYIPLDFIKFAIMWLLNEDGMRQSSLWSRPFLENLGLFAARRNKSSRRAPSVQSVNVQQSTKASARPSTMGRPSTIGRSSVASRPSIQGAHLRASQADILRRSSVNRDAGIF